MKYIKALGITGNNIGKMIVILVMSCILTAILATAGLCALWLVELTTGIVGTLQQGIGLVIVIAGFSCGIVTIKGWLTQALSNYKRRLRAIKIEE